MVQEFEDSVFSLAKDEISQPIKTTYGFHVIQVTDSNEAKQYTLDEVKEDITPSLSREEGPDLDCLDGAGEGGHPDHLQGRHGPVTTTTVAPTETTSGAGTDSTDAPETRYHRAGSTITTALPRQPPQLLRSRNVPRPLKRGGA
jgi:hypothetical protein